MKKRSLLKDIIGTLKNNLSRIIAIIVMVALGSGVFTGFAVGCLNVFQSANHFYDAQNTYDIKIVSTLGLTDDDLSAVSGVEGVSAVFGNNSIDVKPLQSNGNSLLANLNTLDKDGMNEPYVLEGTLPSKAGQIAVNFKFIDDTGLQIGDIITLSEADGEKDAAAADITTANNVDDEADLDITIESDSQAPVLAVAEYEITAIILSPLDISNKEGSMASFSFSASSSDYMMYATAACIDSDIYTAIYLTIDGSSKLDCYSTEYQALMDNMTATIKTTLQKDREEARYDEVVSEANEKITDAEALLADKMTEAEQKLAEAQAEIDDGWVKVNDGWAEIISNESKLSDGEQALTDAKKSAKEKFDASQKEIDEGWTALNDGEEKLKNQEEATLKQFDSYEQQLAQNQVELNKQKSEADDQLNKTVATLTIAEQQIWNSKAAKQIWVDMVADGVKAAPYLLSIKQEETPTSEQTDAYNTAMATLQTDTQALAVCFMSAGDALSEEQLNAFSTLAVTHGTLNYSQTLLDEKSATLTKQKSDALEQISDAKKEIQDNKAQLVNGQRKLDESKAEVEAQFSDKQTELKDGKQKLADAKKELEEAETELIDGQSKLDENKSDYEASIAIARQKLADGKEEAASISMTKWYVWDRSGNDSFSGLNSDISFIQEITKAFPLIFFLVAILISLTTMTRMVEEDRGLIGTYKSLGYTKYQISMKYIFYSVLACVIGGILGSVIGFYVLPKVIEIIVSRLYVLPTFQLSYYPVYGLSGFGLFLLGIVGATAISCGEMLHKRPAELMRPKAPKAGSRILLEHIHFLWKRLNFLNKVTCRNLFRYKKRAIMTIVGILGCAMLIVFGFGIRDTVGGLMSDQFDTITVYDAIVMTDNLSSEEMKSLSDEWKASKMVSAELQIQTTTLTLRSNDNMDITVMVIPDGEDLEAYVHLYASDTHEAKTLPSDGIVVTQNAAKQLNLTNNDVVSLQNEDNMEYDFPVAFVATNYAGNYVYIRESCYQAAFGDYAENSFLLKLSDNSDAQTWLDTLSDDERILTVSSNQEVRNSFSDVNQIINMIVYLLIGMSAALAFAVLFTLSNINISERERELATVKVLGFLPKEVYSYVNKETFILTLLGILLGMPAGYGITYVILSNVSIADIAFRVRISVAGYLIAAVLTLAFALLVNHITNKALRKIDMVEALKSVE